MLTLEEHTIFEKSRNVHSLHACMIMVCFKNLSYRAFYVAKVQIIISGLPIDAFDFFQR